jgi:hypothetical protein
MIVPYGGHYVHNAYTYRDAFVINRDKSPHPHWCKETYVARPGVTSIVHSYLTFRFLDLMKHPVLSNRKENYTAHRTSLWSQLYARAYSVYFDHWPPSWHRSGDFMMYTTRLIFLLALLPSLYMLVGFIKENLILLDGIIKRQYGSFSHLNTWLFHFFSLGYVGFIIIFTMQYRDFSTMKAIFIFPALICFVYYFVKGYSSVRDRYSKNKIIRTIATCLFLALLFLYCVEIVSLIVHLLLNWYNR